MLVNHSREHFLQLKNVCKSVHSADGEHFVLQSFSHKFEQNEFYAVTGASGSGKTTLLQLLAGLDGATTGTVMLDGRDDLAKMMPQKRLWYRQTIIGLVFQFHYLVYELTALENIMMPAQIRGVDAKTARKQALDLINFVGLSRVAHSLPPTLSGGERQRVAIARALINRPAFILADEPTGSLDEANARVVKDLFLSAQQEFGAGVIIATHDVELFSGDKIQQIRL